MGSKKVMFFDNNLPHFLPLSAKITIFVAKITTKLADNGIYFSG